MEPLISATPTAVGVITHIDTRPAAGGKNKNNFHHNSFKLAHFSE